MGDFANMPTPNTLTSCISSQRSYGATRSNLENTEMKFLSHVVESGDTLQRIAVKYDVPVERLKQLNKIWSSESLFLLKTLKIPYIKQTSRWEDDDDSEDEDDDTCRVEERVESNEAKQTVNEKEINCTIENDAEASDSLDGFFSMIDSRINKCKEDWTKIRSHSLGNTGGVPTVSYNSSDENKVLSPTKHYKHFDEKI